jgi:hypothetical protein
MPEYVYGRRVAPGVTRNATSIGLDRMCYQLQTLAKQSSPQHYQRISQHNRQRSTPRDEIHGKHQWCMEPTARPSGRVYLKVFDPEGHYEVEELWIACEQRQKATVEGKGKKSTLMKMKNRLEDIWEGLKTAGEFICK